MDMSCLLHFMEIGDPLNLWRVWPITYNGEGGPLHFMEIGGTLNLMRRVAD